MTSLDADPRPVTIPAWAAAALAGELSHHDLPTGHTTEHAFTQLALALRRAERKPAIVHCGCGNEIVRYRGDWTHLINPDITGAGDHDPHPSGPARTNERCPLCLVDPGARHTDTCTVPAEPGAQWDGILVP